MKARRYDEVLRARGYECIERVPYAGEDTYIKQHVYNTFICKVTKDSHGKAQSIRFTVATKLPKVTTIDEYNYKFRQVVADREFLEKEATKIIEAFEELKKLKSPKYIYCF